MNGQNFGRYQLLKKLATGGMAEVWLARQSGIEGFQKLCVVKRILPHLAHDPEFVQMFLNEARIAARFSHPNIAQIYDLGEVNGSYFIAMEFVHGEDLGRVMRKAWSSGQWLTRPLAIRIVAAACEGLYYAHSKTDERGNPLKVVHRDISPQNILVSFDGSVKLVDFGIAKAADAQSMTRSGMIKGKFAYMSPEQAAGKPLDHRADIFAVGLVLYELLTGVRPLKRDSELATLQAALECAIEPPSKVADVPEELDLIVMTALAKEPDNRYRDARALQMALEEFLVGQRWVATSVQVAELMSALFQDRLEEEAKLGYPDPGADDLSSTSGAAVASDPPRKSSRSGMRAANATGMNRDAPPGAQVPERPTRDSGQRGGPRKVAKAGHRSGEAIRAPASAPPSDVPAWEAPPAAEIRGPQRRTSSETRAAELPRRTSSEAGPSLGGGRTPSRQDPPPLPRRPSTTRAAAVEASAHSQSGRSAARPSNASLLRASEAPRLDVDEDDERTELPDEVAGDNGLVARGKSGQFSLRAHKRVTRDVEQPEPPPSLRVERDPEGAKAKRRPPAKEEVEDSELIDSGARRKAVKIAVVVGVGLVLGLGGLLFRDQIRRLLTSTANDGAEIYVSVDSNLQVDLYVQHAAEENRSDPVVFLGRNPLKKVGGVHVRDTLIFENRPLGLRYLHEIPFGQPGEIRQIVKDFQMGSCKLHFEPKTLTDLHLYIHGQQVGSYPGPKLDLVEGKHTLEVRGAQLREPVQFEVDVIPGQVTERVVDLGRWML